MSTTHIQLEPRASERRCALCHGGLGLEPTTCPDCGTASHADCLDEARRCPTLGCARPTITRSEREVVDPSEPPRTQVVRLGLTLGLGAFALGYGRILFSAEPSFHLLELLLYLAPLFAILGGLAAWLARLHEEWVHGLRGGPRLLSWSYAPLLPVALALVWLGAWFADLSAGLF